MTNIENLVGGAHADRLDGDAGANELTGGAGADTLRGDLGDDLLTGGGGADRLLGNAGDDTLIGGARPDVLKGGPGVDLASYATSSAGVDVRLHLGTGAGGDAAGDSLTGIENLVGGAHTDRLEGDSGANVITGGAGNDTLRGSNGDDLLIGGAGANLIRGGADDDTLIGGAGADVLNGGGGTDLASYAASSAGVDVRLGAGAATGGDAAGDSLTNIENLEGGAHADRLDGDGGANVISGRAGADTLRGALGDDLLIGGAGPDSLLGNAGDDTLVGGGRADVLNGGAGTDLASYAASSAAVDVRLGAGTASGGDAAGDSLTGIENLEGGARADRLDGDGGANVITGGARADTLRGALGDDLLIGGSGPDSLTGNAGDDTLVGGVGADMLNGGAGTDLASYAASSAAVDVDVRLGAGTASGGDAAGDSLTGIENLEGSAFADRLDGDGGANRISGGAGADTLRGAGGDDLLIGGAGPDSLTGNAGDDTLAGGAGADVVNGGFGTDFASFAASSAGVDVRLHLGTASGGHAAGDSLTNIENLVGSAHRDRLDGDAGANELTGGTGADTLRGDLGDDLLSGGGGADSLLGNAGDDTLVGGARPDVLNGGPGVDVASYAASSAGVDVRLHLGAGAGGDAAGDSLTGIENLVGSAHTDRLEGDAGANIIRGGAGDDTLRGAGGDDLLTGGAGANLIRGGKDDDTLIGAAGADVLNGGGETDTASYAGSSGAVDVRLWLGTASGGDAAGDSLMGIENLIGGAQADRLEGDSGANVITGGAGDDTLRGAGGDDLLTGGAGANLIRGGADDDTLIGAAGADTLEAGTEDDLLIGGAGDDVLRGLGGNDTLVGGFGSDTLIGGGGADSYHFFAGDGVDTVIETDDTGASITDRLVLRNISSITDIEFSRDGSSLILDLGGGDRVVAIGLENTTGLREIFSDPTITTFDGFGRSVSIDGDNVLVGAWTHNTGGAVTGQAHLFDALSGNLLRTFDDPTPRAFDFFGYSVAIDGNNVLVGAWGDDTGETNAGQAHLFSAGTGNLLHTFNAPTPTFRAQFGSSVALDGDNVLIGARQSGAHLFDAATGNLLRTFNAPANSTGFGASVGIDGDNVLIGDIDGTTGIGGRAHLFDIVTGNLLLTFDDPTPTTTDQFGSAVALDGDYVLIGEQGDDTSGQNNGQAHLFDAATGNLLHTFNEPNPAIGSDGFGFSVAIDGDNVLIGEISDGSVGDNVGQAHLFDSITGDLLRTFNDPTPTDMDEFGTSVALDGDNFLVGARGDDTDGNDVGQAYLFGAIPSTRTAVETLELSDGGVFTLNTDLTGGIAGDVIVGTGSAETIAGVAGDDYVVGDGGDDTLLGGASADTLVGGPGADQLRGKSGADAFFYIDLSHGTVIATNRTVASSGLDTDSVNGFVSGEDRFALNAPNFDATAGFVTIGSPYDGTNSGVGSGAAVIFDGTHLLYDPETATAGYTVVAEVNGDSVIATDVSFV